MEKDGHHTHFLMEIIPPGRQMNPIKRQELQSSRFKWAKFLWRVKRKICETSNYKVGTFALRKESVWNLISDDALFISLHQHNFSLGKTFTINWKNRRTVCTPRGHSTAAGFAGSPRVVKVKTEKNSRKKVSCCRFPTICQTKVENFHYNSSNKTPLRSSSTL